MLLRNTLSFRKNRFLAIANFLANLKPSGTSGFQSVLCLAFLLSILWIGQLEIALVAMGQDSPAVRQDEAQQVGALGDQVTQEETQKDEQSKDESIKGDLLLERNEPIDDLCSGIIDNRRIYNTFVMRGRRLIGDERILDAQEMNEIIGKALFSFVE
jgi:hypothetical protein